MAVSEEIIREPLREKASKKGFVHLTKTKIAAVGLGVALVGGAGALSAIKNENPSPEPTPVTGVGVVPEPSATSTPDITIPPPLESPSISPTPTEKPTPTPTEIPLPSWAKEIQPAKWPINEVPINPITKESGQLIEYPVPGSSDYILSMQNGTIVAVEADVESNTIWVALTVNGDTLSEKSGTVDVEGKNKDYYKYKGITVWYGIDNNTVIMKKDSNGPGTSHVGTGLDYAANHLEVGKTLYGVLSPLNSEAKDGGELNKATLNEIKSSIGEPNQRDNKEFTMYSTLLSLP